MLDVAFDLLRLVIDGVEHVFEDAFADSTKVDEALRQARRRDAAEILLFAAWHGGALTEASRSALEEELERIDLLHLTDELASPRDSLDDDAVIARVRELAEGFTAGQRSYTLAAVERVIGNSNTETGYRDPGTRSVDRTLRVFREALS